MTFTGRNVIGAGATVGDGATLADSILWAGAQVAPDEKVHDAILAPGLALHITTSAQEPRQQ